MKKWLYWTLILFFSAVFCVCAWYLADYFIESHKQKSQFDELAQLVEQSKQETTPAPTEPDETEPGETTPKETAPSGASVSPEMSTS